MDFEQITDSRETLRPKIFFMEKIKRHWKSVTLGAVVIALFVGWIAKRYWLSDKTPAYLTATVTRADIENSVLAIGTLEAYKQVDVGSRTSGQLKSLKVTRGDIVKKDQLLAEIDPSLQINKLRAAQIEKEILSRDQEEKSANLRYAAWNYQRQQQLLKHDSTSRQAFEEARSKWLALKASVAALQARIRKAQTDVEVAQTDLGFTRITAPIDGEVVGIVTKEGQTVIASQLAPVILKLADMRTMTVKIQVPEADVIRTHPGQTAYFTILGQPKRRFYGKLREVESAPQNFLEEKIGSGSSSQNKDAAVFYNALFDIPNADRQLRIGMTTETHIVLDAARKALIIPTAALSALDAKGNATVRVLSSRNQLQVRKVQVGINNSVKAQILAGLNEGEQVIIGEPNDNDEKS